MAVLLGSRGMRAGRSLAWLFLTAALPLAGCAMPGQYQAPGPGATTQPVPARTAKAAILLPLSGPNASLGTDMLKAAHLAYDAPGIAPLDVRDTGGTPAGAARAASDALAAGDTIILGPLTAGETAAVAPVAKQANVPVLAFTSDPANAAPGIWPLGLTPGQQVRRVIAAAHADGRDRIAALLPEGAFGDAMAAALDGMNLMPPATVQRYAAGPSALAEALRQLTGAPPPAPAPPAPDQISPGFPPVPVPVPAPEPAAPPVAAAPAPLPPPILTFTALLLGESGAALRGLTAQLPRQGVTMPQVRVLGTALWSRDTGRLGGLAGAWYAAPDPSSRQGFVDQFEAKYGKPPPPLSDFAYDAAAIARVQAEDRAGAEALTRPQGFAGVDGVFALDADGHVRRGLALFEIAPGGGSRLIQSAPASLAEPAA